jgi:hypothetical protein
MSDIFKLILRAVIELFQSKASLEMEILTLRHQINVLRRNKEASFHKYRSFGFCCPLSVGAARCECLGDR